MDTIANMQKKLFEIIKPGCHAVIIAVSSGDYQMISNFAAIRITVNNGYSVTTESPYIDFNAYGDQHCDDIINFIGSDIIIGYNAGFAIRMIEEMAERQGKTFDRAVDIDLLGYVRGLFEKCENIPNHKLSTIHKVAFPEMDRLSLTECLMMVHLLEFSLKKYAEYIPNYASDCKLIRARISYNFQTKKNPKIVLKLNIGGEGDVYYDGEWNVSEKCKNEIFLPTVITQFREMYLKPFGYETEQEYINAAFEMAEKIGTKKSKGKKKKD